MTDRIKNITASVKARLANVAKAEALNFDSVLLLFMQERLLYRLSISDYKDRFVLKGGLLILCSTNIKTRPTKDIDFLAKNITNNLDKIKQIFQRICMIEVNDGVFCDPDSITLERITETGNYQGVRLKIKCYLDNTRKLLQLDIGFGDEIVPKETEMNYPVLLDFESPKIKAYSLESVIAEKFEAMLRLSLLNSRMKDFYDIFILSKLKKYDGRVLYEAIYTTLQRRGTPIEGEHVIFAKSFAQDKERTKLWQGYLRRIGKKEIAFEDIMHRIKLFICPIYENILSENEFFGIWDSVKSQWCEYED